MRDLVAASFANAPAPQAPARNRDAPVRQPSTTSLDTYNSHRRARPRLERRAFRPALARIDEAEARASVDLASARPVLRSCSHASADSGRSVPVCNDSRELGAQLSCSPHYAEPRRASPASPASSEPPASMSDLPVALPLDAATGAYIPYEYVYYRDDACGLDRYKLHKRMRKFSSKHTNLYLAFMY